MRRSLPIILILSCVMAAGYYLVSSNHFSSETDEKEAPSAVRLSGKHSFEKDIDDYARLLRLPSLAIGVARGDSLVFFKGAGTPNSLCKESLTPDHIFPIASITKSFTAVALKQMEGEGKLSLKDPVSMYPNEYFTEERWDPQTTLAQIISHTSESDPPGTQFVYNGGKFNIVFNVFSALSKTRVPGDLTRPFTDEIQSRILTPLKMDHTLLRFAGKEHGHLKKWVAQTYRLDDSAGKFVPAEVEPDNLQSGPGYGMMSSVNDLVTYSSALSQHHLLTAAQYEQITLPFYPGSPYGMGWFTSEFEGTKIHWVYGYGDNDASLLLRVPAYDLTLIMLAPCALPSASIRLGYGNPFNSLLVCSFFKNFVQATSTGSRLHIEEKFAKAATLSFLPASFHPDASAADSLLRRLMGDFPSDTIWQTPAAFEVVASSEDRDILKFGLKMAEKYLRQDKLHPVIAWYAGLICQKNGEQEKAIACFEPLGWGDQYREQPYKFNAMMELAKRHMYLAPRHAREILKDLMRFKEYINVNDQQYRDAEEMLK
ncbi:serine hydrolase domain-containing protein [Anseongella ginsenosidimutans]|nr:serine hydrolase domain-containing protein [Anseongella ginsenosidimutans]